MYIHTYLPPNTSLLKTSYSDSKVMRHMISEECSELEKLLSEESSGSKDGASLAMGRSSTKVHRCTV